MRTSALLICVVGLLLPTFGRTADDPIPGRKPNLIFILADDLGYGELGCYAQDRMRTPRCDRMAAEALPNKKGFDFFYGFLNQTHAHNYYPDFLWRNAERIKLEANVQSPTKGVAAKRAEYAPDLFQKEALAFIEQHKDGPFFLYYATTI